MIRRPAAIGFACGLLTSIARGQSLGQPLARFWSRGSQRRRVLGAARPNDFAGWTLLSSRHRSLSRGSDCVSTFETAPVNMADSGSYPREDVHARHDVDGNIRGCARRDSRRFARDQPAGTRNDSNPEYRGAGWIGFATGARNQAKTLPDSSKAGCPPGSREAPSFRLRTVGAVSTVSTRRIAAIDRIC